MGELGPGEDVHSLNQALVGALGAQWCFASPEERPSPVSTLGTLFSLPRTVARSSHKSQERDTENERERVRLKGRQKSENDRCYVVSVGVRDSVGEGEEEAAAIRYAVRSLGAHGTARSKNAQNVHTI